MNSNLNDKSKMYLEFIPRERDKKEVLVRGCIGNSGRHNIMVVMTRVGLICHELI